MGCGASKGGGSVAVHGGEPASSGAGASLTPSQVTDKDESTRHTQAGDSRSGSGAAGGTAGDEGAATGTPQASGPSTGPSGGDGQPVEVWHCAVSLAFLQRFAADVVKVGWTTYDILREVVLPATAESRCRYVDTLPPGDRATLTFFISYAWSMPFTTLVALLSHHLHSADPRQVYCWVDVLAINQHPGRQQSRDLQDLEEAVRLAQGTLVCLDPACVPFTRTWCLFEWWTTLRMRGLRHLVFLADPATRRRLGELYHGIDIRKAQATVDSDRERILTAIGDALDLVNAQLKLLFLLEPYDTSAAAIAAIPASASGISGGGGDSKARWRDGGAADGDALPAVAGDDGGGANGDAVAKAAPYGSQTRPWPSTASSAAAGGAFARLEGADWTAAPIRRWLERLPGDERYRSLALVGPVGCGKSYGTAAALAALTAAYADADVKPVAVADSATDSANTPGGGVASPSQSTPSRHGSAHSGSRSSSHNSRSSTGSSSSRCRTRPVAAHFCRTDDAPSTDPLVMVRSLAFQLACQTHGPFAAFLQKRYLGLSREAIAGLTRPDTAFNVLLLHPLNDLMPPQPAEDAPPPPAWLLKQQQAAAVAAPDEVVLIVDGVDEVEVAGGLLHDNRILLALRDLFPLLPPRVRFLVTTRRRPDHILRSLTSKIHPWVVEPRPPPTGPATAPAASATAPAAQNFLLDTILSLLPSAARPMPLHAAPPPSLPAAYAALFTAALRPLDQARRVGVAALLELLLASPEPPTLHVIAQLGLASHLGNLPGWGVVFHTAWGYRLHVLHRSLLEWLRGEGCGGNSAGGAGEGGGGDAMSLRYGAAAALSAAGVRVEEDRGHSLLADWVLADLRGSKRPQSYSLRYAVYHLAKCVALYGNAGGAEGDGAEGPAGNGHGTAGLRPRKAPARWERVRQLDELLVDLDFWRQVYLSRLGAGVLRDLTTLPGLDSPTARDVVRMIQRDHTSLEHDPDLLPNLAFETPLGSATRTAAAAAASAAAAAAVASVGAASANTGGPGPPSAAPGARSQPGPEPGPGAGSRSGSAHLMPCVVAAPVYPAWPACVAVVSGEGRGGRSAGLFAVRFAPDGRTFAAANNVGTVLVHDTSTGERVLKLVGHIDYVHDVAFIAATAPDTTTSTITDTIAARSQADGAEGGGGRRDLGPRRAAYLVTGGSDQTIRLWDAVTGDEVCCLRHHQRPITSVAISPDQRHMASTDEDGAVCLWRLAQSGQVAAEARPVQGSHPQAAFCCVFGPGGHQLASGGKDGCVRFWDVASGQQVGHIDVRAGAGGSSKTEAAISSPGPAASAGGPAARALMVKCLAFTTDGASLLVGLSGGDIGVWRRAGAWSRPPSASPPAQRQPPSAAGTGSGSGTSSGGGGGRGGLAWSLGLTLGGHTSDVGGIAVTAEARTAFSAGYDNTVRVWDLTSGSQVAVLYGHSDYAVGCDLSYDGRHLASAGSDGTVRIWDAALAASAPAPQQHALDVMQMTVAHANGYVATASKDKTICIWAVPAPAPAAAPSGGGGGATPPSPPPPPPPPPPQPYDVAAPAAGTAMDREVASADQPTRSTAGGTAVSWASSQKTRGGETGEPGASAGARGGQPPETGVRQARQWYDEGLGLMMQLTGHTAHVATIALAPDEVTLASGSYDSTIRMYRLDLPEVPELVLAEGHKAFVTAVAFDAWGTRLASGGGDGTLGVWDAAAWQEHHFSSTTTAVPAAAAVTRPASAAVAVGTAAVAAMQPSGAAGAESTAAAASWLQPLQLQSIEGARSVWSLAWSPVDYLFAAGHNSMAISVCDGVQPGQPRRESLLCAIYQPEEGADNGYNGHVYGVAWSPDGRWLAGGYSGFRGGHVRLWDVTCGKQVADFAAHDKDVWAVTFDPSDQNILASCSYDGTAAIWSLSDLRSPSRIALLRGHRGTIRSVAFMTRGPPARPTSVAAGDGGTIGPVDGAGGGDSAGGGGGGVGGGAAAAGGSGAVGSLVGPSKVLLTTGTDATVRVWSYQEVLRRRDVSYICPWALTG